jgi:DNA repair exonuclease SbcCD ATPase subunit
MKYIVDNIDKRKYVYDNYDDIQRYIEYSKLPEDYYELVKLEKELTVKMDLVKTLSSKLVTYIEHFYNDNILPKISNIVTEIINNFDKSVCIKGVMTNDNIEWRMNGLPLTKASGFQRFIIGISFRLTLSYINNTHFQQLFIDEGFSSCDSSNLEKVPDFLNKLLNSFYFDSILIITHISELKDSIKTISVGDI